MTSRFITGITTLSFETLYVLLLVVFVALIIWHIYLVYRIHMVRGLKKKSKNVKRTTSLGFSEDWYLSRRDFVSVLDTLAIFLLLAVSIHIEGSEYIEKEFFYFDVSLACVWFIFSILGRPRSRAIK